jgi:hypothetical protein
MQGGIIAGGLINGKVIGEIKKKRDIIEKGINREGDNWDNSRWRAER